MPFYLSPVPAPRFDSDESDEASQQSNDSSSYLSTQFSQHTRLSYSPTIDDSNDSTSYNRKRKRFDEFQSLQTPHQSPCTRQKNLDYTQETIFQSPKIQRRSRYHDEIHSFSTTTKTNFVHVNPFASEHHHSKTSFSQLLIQRYEQEFHQQSQLGSGQFSHVYLCTNRLDGLNYAIKTSKQSIVGTNYEQFAWRELCAYGLLNSHENLVRYYSSWIETDGRFYLQLEYCNQGSIEDLLQKQHLFDENQLKNLLHQMSDVLHFLHENDFAHMDIKPSNIMLCQYANDEYVYKLTDLGHICRMNSSWIDDNDGDSRYLALEAIDKCSNEISLDKCDIFSLGLTIYVCATNYQLPKQGNEWRQLRMNIRDYLNEIKHCSKEFNEFLFQRMCHVNFERRATAHEILLETNIHPKNLTSRQALQIHLKQEREKNLCLNKKLLDQYIDLQILPNDQTMLSPIQSNVFVPQQIISTPTNSRLLVLHTPSTPTYSSNQTIHSPTIALKQQIKLAGSNMFRYYSSII